MKILVQIIECFFTDPLKKHSVRNATLGRKAQFLELHSVRNASTNTLKNWDASLTGCGHRGGYVSTERYSLTGIIIRTTILLRFSRLHRMQPTQWVWHSVRNATLGRKAQFLELHSVRNASTNTLKNWYAFLRNADIVVDTFLPSDIP